MRWRWNRMAIARHRNKKGNGMVRVDNMQHILGDQ